MGTNSPNQQDTRPEKWVREASIFSILCIIGLGLKLIFDSLAAHLTSFSDRTSFIFGLLSVVASFGQWLLPDFSKRIHKVWSVIIREKALMLPPQQDPIRLPPYNLPPRRYLDHFTGREKFLKSLEDGFFKENRSLQTIGGGRGTGKSMVALKYAYEYGDYKTVVWLDASSLKTLGKGCHEILKELEIIPSATPEPPDDPERRRTIQRVSDWLVQQKNWLLVLDGYRGDSAKRFIDISTPPQPDADTRKHILITSDLPAIAGSEYLQLPSMDSDDEIPHAASLFLRISENTRQHQPLADYVEEGRLQEAKDIVKTLGYLPLAIVHAAVHARTCCSLDSFLERFHQDPDHFLTTTCPQTQTYLDYFMNSEHYSFTTVWDTITELTKATNGTSAAKLLRLCAFLAPAPARIPKTLLLAAPALDTAVNGKFMLTEAELNDAKQKLLEHSLVDYYDGNNSAFTISSILQEIIKAKMALTKDTTNLRVYAECAVKAVNTQFPAVEFSKWQTCQDYLPHARICCKDIKKYAFPSPLPEAIELLYNTGCFLLVREEFAEAEELLNEAEELLKIALTRKKQPQQNQNRPSLAQIYTTLGELYHVQGKLDTADEMYKQAENSKPVGDDPVIIAIHQGQLSDDLGYDDMATKYYDKAETFIKTNTSSNMLVLKATLLNNQASLQMKQGKGRWGDAEEKFKEALGIFKARLQENNHPFTLECRANLVTLLILKGDITSLTKPISIQQIPKPAEGYSGETLNALDCYQDTLKIGKNIIGMQRLQNANRHNSIAELYRTFINLDQNAQEDYEAKAKEQYELALGIYKTRCNEHPRHAIILMNYAAFLQQTSFRYSTWISVRSSQEEAQKILEKYTEKRKTLLASPHPVSV